MTGEPTTEELIAAVRKAGWLLEQESAAVLLAAEMHPRMGWAFQDPDDASVSREIDVWGFRRFLYDEENQVSVTARVMVECKQSSMPYVAIGGEAPRWLRSGNPPQHHFPAKSFLVRRDGPRSHYQSTWDVFGLNDLQGSAGQDRFRATQLTRLDRVKGGDWSADNRGIFNNLIYPLAKACLSDKSNRRSRDHVEPSVQRVRTGWDEVSLGFPIVVTSAPIYVINADGGEPYQVEERPWVTVTRDLKSKSVTGRFDIDIVTASALERFVGERIVQFSTAVAEVVQRDPLAFIGHQWTIPD